MRVYSFLRAEDNFLSGEHNFLRASFILSLKRGKLSKITIPDKKLSSFINQSKISVLSPAGRGEAKQP